MKKSDSEFICDICGELKTGDGFPVYNENFEDENIIQCEDCFKKQCNID